jgi:hypothetical protein
LLVVGGYVRKEINGFPPSASSARLMVVGTRFRTVKVVTFIEAC